MDTLPQNAINKLKEIRKRFSELPVPVIAIAQDLGIKIYETHDFDIRQSGSIKKEDQDFVIYIKASDPPSRKRFSIAYGIAYFLMYKDSLESGNEFIAQFSQPKKTSNIENSVSNNQNHNREYEANAFAASLLMPEDEFIEAFEKSSSIEQLADTFMVSVSAVAIRARDLLGVFIM